MGQDRLTRIAGGVVALAGIAAEAGAAAGSSVLTVGDYVAGFALAAVPDPLAVIAGGGWFGGTAASGSSLPTWLGTALVLLYRGPLLHLVLRTVSNQPLWWLTAAWSVALLPYRTAGLVTVAIAVVLMTVAVAKRHWAVALCLAGLVAVWLPGALGVTARDGLTIATDLAVLLTAVAVAATIDDSSTSSRVHRLVVELGPASDGGPVSERLRRLLSDPGLQVRYSIPDVGWVDEDGAAVEAPNSHDSTMVPLEDGAAVCLLHSRRVDSEVAQAAAVAAGVAFGTARVDAEVRRKAEAVRASRLRLLTVADDERRVLEAQLRTGPLQRLDRVSDLLSEMDDPDAAALAQDVATISDDLGRLALGLFPSAVEGRHLSETLAILAASAGLPVELDTSELTDEPPAWQRALVHFVVAEALANVLRHAHATGATITARTSDGLVVEVADDGVGGADLSHSRGLRGLAERAAARDATLRIDSPRGGPTVLSLTIPQARR